jgi:lysophospholipase L1-like esterase
MKQRNQRDQHSSLSAHLMMFAALAGALAACSADNGGDSTDGTGGAAGATMGMAGAPGSGGAGSGGRAGTAGAPGTGGGAGGTSDGGVTPATGGRSGAGGASGVGGRATGGAPGDAGISADGGANPDGGSGTPGVRIVGRTAPGASAGSVRFEWSGVSIAARFTGTQVSIQLSDANNQNEFAVVVDGTVRAKVVTVNGQTTYPLATGLAAGTHDLLVWRRTEAKWGPTDFLGLTGFSAGGGLLPPPAAPAHQMEIIGDSITAGVGIEQVGPCTGTEINENNYLAYGSVAARALGADLVTIAWQGIGMYRNYNEMAPVAGDPTMPQRYDFSIPTASTAWNFALYQPQAVVINLTSNDFSVFGDPGTNYVNTYVSFIQHLRSKYPSAYFFCVIEWSNATSNSATDTNQIVNLVRQSGDARIEAFDIRPFANGNACEGHPDTAGGQAMGTGLATEIKRVLGW